MEQVVESFVSIQRQINSLASVALRNRWALDLLTAEKGGTCLLGDDCCYFVNETGIVQGRIKELRDRIERCKKQLQNLYTPKPVPTSPPLVTPFLETIGTYHFIPLIWTLSLQSLSKFSPGTDLGHLSSPSQDCSFAWNSDSKNKKSTLWPMDFLPPRLQTPDPHLSAWRSPEH